MHERSTGNVTDVGGKRKNTVQYDTEAFNLGGDLDWVTVIGNIEGVSFGELGLVEM